MASPSHSLGANMYVLGVVQEDAFDRIYRSVVTSQGGIDVGTRSRKQVHKEENLVCAMTKSILGYRDSC